MKGEYVVSARVSPTFWINEWCPTEAAARAFYDAVKAKPGTFWVELSYDDGWEFRPLRLEVRLDDGTWGDPPAGWSGMPR